MFLSVQECRQLLQEYLARLSELADDAMNCSAVLNWFEVSYPSQNDCLYSEGGVSLCYCAYVLRISGWPEKLGFLRGCLHGWRKILALERS